MRRILFALAVVCAITLFAHAQEQPAKDGKKDARAQSAPAPPEQIALDEKQHAEVVRVYNAVSAAEAARNQAWVNVVNVDLKDSLKVIAIVGEAKTADKEVARATLERELIMDQLRKVKQCDGCGISQDGKFLLKAQTTTPTK